MNIWENEKIDKICLVIILLFLISIILLILFDVSFKEKEVLNNNDILELDKDDIENNSKEEENNLDNSLLPEEIKYHVDIKGAVKNPGVYEVLSTSIINDVINLAGGLKSNASTKFINLSRKVSNEMVIYIYTTTEVNNLKITSEKNCQNNNVDISSCEGSATVETTNKEPNQSNSENNQNNDSKDNNNNNNNDNNSNDSNKDDTNTITKVNINTASKEELMTLNGIGESKALAIIEYREKNGGFKNIEEIMNVSGIGEAAYQKIKDYLTV